MEESVNKDQVWLVSGCHVADEETRTHLTRQRSCQPKWSPPKIPAEFSDAQGAISTDSYDGEDDFSATYEARHNRASLSGRRAMFVRRASMGTDLSVKPHSHVPEEAGHKVSKYDLRLG
jgi:hypothetical protein